MKKVLKLLFVIVLMLPILVLAESFSSEKNRANKILTKLPQTYDMYLVTGSNIPFGYRSNGTLEVVDGFNRAGFISLYEYNNSKVNGQSYLFEGSNYWTLTSSGSNYHYVVGLNDAVKDASKYRARATEFVKSSVKVRGSGTISDPWVFVTKYKVTFTTPNTSFGVIRGASSYGSCEVICNSGACTSSNDSLSLVCPAGSNADIDIEALNGNIYLRNTCNLEELASNKLRIKNIRKDMTCNIVFGSGIFDITLGEDTDNIVPRHMYLKYKEGYYKDRSANEVMKQLESYPKTKTGYKFDGLVTNDDRRLLIVNKDGKVLQETRDKINEDTMLVIKWLPNNYTVTFDPNGGSTPSVASIQVTYGQKYYDGNFPTTTKTGNKFEGWYTESSGGIKITPETEVSILEDQTLYAHWTPCAAGTFLRANECVKCAVGSYNTGTANTTCTICIPSGETGTNGTTATEGKTSCGSSCNKSHVNTWKTPSWNNNNPTNVCEINTCKAGYKKVDNTCEVCPAGTYSSAGSTSCSSCPSGFTSAAGSTSINDCKITCAAKTYLPAGGTSCTQCKAGHYCGGKTCNYGSSSNCGIAKCGAGKYSAAGASSCSNCPGSMTSDAGSTAKTDCRIECAAGTYLAKSASACSTCTENNYCEGMTCNYSGSSNCGITACPSGYTNSTGQSAKSSCKITCAKNTRVAKKDETCTSCGSGYTIASHTVSAGKTSSACTATTVKVYVHGTVKDTITVKNSSGTTVATITTGSDARSSQQSLPIGNLTFTSSVAKNLSNGGAYSKTIEITSSTTNAYVFPDGAVYWYGNGTAANSALNNRITSWEGSVLEKSLHCHIQSSGGQYTNYCKSSAIKTTISGTKYVKVGAYLSSWKPALMNKCGMYRKSFYGLKDTDDNDITYKDSDGNTVNRKWLFDSSIVDKEHPNDYYYYYAYRKTNSKDKIKFYLENDAYGGKRNGCNYVMDAIAYVHAVWLYN